MNDDYEINVPNLHRVEIEGKFTQEETVAMPKLTKEQSKMAIEYFAKQAAEEAPRTDKTWVYWDRHMWMTLYTASLAIERIINMSDWAALVNAALDSQSFDRDPAGYLHERGEPDTSQNVDYMRGVLEDVLSASIDTVFNTSRAA